MAEGSIDHNHIGQVFPIEVDDIQVAKDGTWYSLRDQKVAKGGAGHNFGAGCAVAKDGKWYALKELNVVTVTYMGNGGSPTSQTRTHVIGSVLQAPIRNPLLSGASLVGWSTTQNGFHDVLTVGTTIVTADMTIYAIWIFDAPTVDPTPLSVTPSGYTFAYNETTAKQFSILLT